MTGTARQLGCIYCGGWPLTREHVVPTWLNELLRVGDEGKRDPMLDNASRVADRDGVRPATRFGSVGLNMTVKAVCKTCNEGWMSSLEGCTKDLITELATGNRTKVSGGQQILLAAWATKTALMMSRMFAHTALTRILLDAGFDSQRESPDQPSVNCIVRLGRRLPVDAQIQCLALEAHNAADKSWASPDEALANSVVITIGIGELVLQIVAGVAAGQPFTAPERWPLVIWPVKGDLRWPPASPPLEGEDALMSFHQEPVGIVLNADFQLPLLMDDDDEADDSSLADVK